MAYAAPAPDVGKALAVKTASTLISYIPIVGPVLSSFAGPIVDAISGMFVDQGKLFRDWEAAYLAAGPHVWRTEPTFVTARRRNQARMYLIRILTTMAKRGKR